MGQLQRCEKIMVSQIYRCIYTDTVYTVHPRQAALAILFHINFNLKKKKKQKPLSDQKVLYLRCLIAHLIKHTCLWLLVGG